ncbi:hypothetical protein Leryth_019042, partial [Lithospermum erythrorhizon]
GFSLLWPLVHVRFITRFTLVLAKFRLIFRNFSYLIL